jgi:hypothetical protein
LIGFLWPPQRVPLGYRYLLAFTPPHLQASLGIEALD